MSAWVVLLVALVACLRLGDAQEPIPVSLVNLVMNTPVSSMKDLEELLDVHATEEEEEEEEEEDKDHTNGLHKRLPRSLGDVQIASMAMCKVRTEVMEITRSMLDRSNANFILWPFCVEVQRCSGCCNTRALHCVPITTQTRRLQMTKITFVDKHTVYESVVIPVEDHLSCSCKSRTVSQTTFKKTTTSPPPPPRLITKLPISKSQSKEELHRHDDLKHNQRFQLEDRETPWESKYTVSQTQRVPVHTLTHTLSSEDASTRHTNFGVKRMLSDTTQHLTPVQEHHSEPEKIQEHHQDHHSEQEKVKEHHRDHHSKPEKVQERHRDHHSEQEKVQGQNRDHQFEPEKVQEKHTHPGSGDASIKSMPSAEHQHHESVTTPQHDQSNTTEHSNSQSDVTLHHSGQMEAPFVRVSHVEVIGQSSSQSKLSRQSSTPSFQQSEEKDQHQSQSETEAGQNKTDHHQHHYHHHHHSTQAATQRAVTNAPTGTSPVPHTPPPAVPQRKRRRKQRRRMSKSAMRAMIM